jgi:signal transduction histidine kinase
VCADHEQPLEKVDTTPADYLATVERRLARLRYDLHDGPQQDIHLLALDLDLFREQLLPSIADEPNADRLLGRLDDLSARLVALDRDIRNLALSLESPFQQSAPLAEALGEILDAFSARTGIEPQLSLDGDLSKATASQRIALLALVREALSNVREHSAARNVTVSLSAHPDGVQAQVTDDGRGFEPAATLRRVERDGHLGLIGMRERAAMLGGETKIESRPGGPTVVTVSLPAWPKP